MECKSKTEITINKLELQRIISHRFGIMTGSVIKQSFGFLFQKKLIILTFFLNLFNKLAFAYNVAQLKLFASISATDAPPER